MGVRHDTCTLGRINAAIIYHGKERESTGIDAWRGFCCNTQRFDKTYCTTFKANKSTYPRFIFLYNNNVKKQHHFDTSLYSVFTL